MNEVLEYRLRTIARHTVWGARDIIARPTASRRVLPDYLIIGAQRCGTTTLQGLISSHPRVQPPMLRKGIHYFDTDFKKGESWYRSQFPFQARASEGFVTGEASPYYLFHPLAPGRIVDLIPDIKVIALLRDPVERAISHHKHEVRRGYEDLALTEALGAEEDRLAGEEEKMAADPGYVSFAHQHHSYQRRGFYLDQLKRYEAMLGRQNMLVVESETFWSEPEKIFGEVLSFLQLEFWMPESIPQLNATGASRTDDSVRSGLRERFADANAALREEWGVGVSWP